MIISLLYNSNFLLECLLFNVYSSNDFNSNTDAGADEFFTKVSSIRDQSKFSFDRDILKGLYFQEKNNLPQAESVILGLTSSSDFQRLAVSKKAQIWFWLSEVAQANKNNPLALNPKVLLSITAVFKLYSS